MGTPKPPYVFPRQRPTDESGTNVGDTSILIYRRFQGQLGFWWSQPRQLTDGSVWVPTCDAFFDDWAPGDGQVWCRHKRASSLWTNAAETLSAEGQP